MKEDANPYAPPAGEPSAPSPEDWAGRLWRVEEGRLLVKDRASLPNVCIHGGAPEEGGSRCSLQIYSLSWRRRLLVLLSAGGLAAFSIAEGWSWVPALLAAWFLQEVLGKKIRVMVFRCPAERRKSAIRIIGLIGIAWLLYRFFARSPGYLEELVVPAVILALLIAAWSISPRCAALGEGWFRMQGIAPEALARLEEIQSRIPVPQERPAPRNRGINPGT